MAGVVKHFRLEEKSVEQENYFLGLSFVDSAVSYTSKIGRV